MVNLWKIQEFYKFTFHDHRGDGSEWQSFLFDFPSTLISLPLWNSLEMMTPTGPELDVVE